MAMECPVAADDILMEGGDEGAGGVVEHPDYKVVGVIRQKILFQNRPKPIVGHR